jgi:Flp pilus assembly pilin Flp
VKAGGWVQRLSCSVGRFLADRSAATAIEYALVAGIMAVALAGFSGLFDALREGFLEPTQKAVQGVADN